MDSGSIARRELEYARRKALMYTLLSTVRGEENHLIPFEWVRYLKPSSEHYRGTQTIEVEAIIGSVDRYDEFDRHFLPLEDYLDERWIAIRRAQLEGRELPPIQVYKVGGVYFVKDGNHRVSVARRERQKYIDAEVIELDVMIEPAPGDTLKDLILKGEQAAFLRETRLEEVRPQHTPILFSTPGRFDILLDHIRTRQYYLGMKHGREVSWEEAVGSWYDRLYSRVVEHLRAHGVLDRFPGRTEADLYLWIMDHRYFLTEQYGFDVGSEQAVTDFSAHYAPRWYERMGTRLKRWWQGKPLKPHAAR
ncbi:hypothetical protein HNR42_000458 [Deinobacterium chartae]|uniref:DUF4032 domain-containing protein n=1 Tax=Deinobacterium chartae TaxID=521158 RepID=A0A841HWM0_9DEIO|nr:DUF4032 domain-containing protein [Deinobacterium chartae]MBB6097044.1 hypothetical protein [Deinobacterium chartae]